MFRVVLILVAALMWGIPATARADHLLDAPLTPAVDDGGGGAGPVAISARDILWVSSLNAGVHVVMAAVLGAVSAYTLYFVLPLGIVVSIASVFLLPAVTARVATTLLPVGRGEAWTPFYWRSFLLRIMSTGLAIGAISFAGLAPWFVPIGIVGSLVGLGAVELADSAPQVPERIQKSRPVERPN